MTGPQNIPDALAIARTKAASPGWKMTAQESYAIARALLGLEEQVQALQHHIDVETDSHQATSAALANEEDKVDELKEQFDTLRRAVEAWDATLSSYCDGPERDAVRAALSNPAQVQHTGTGAGESRRPPGHSAPAPESSPAKRLL